MKPVICLDLDGCLLDFSDGYQGFDQFGPPIPGAVEFTRRLSEFADVVVHTCRTSEGLNRPYKSHLLVNAVRRFLDEHGFCYAEVWAGQGKPIADAYIDDRAVACGLEPQDGEDAAYVVYRLAELAARQLCGQRITNAENLKC